MGEGRELLALARRAVEAAVLGSAEPPPISDCTALQRLGGAFVTLRRREGGALRGCIGHQPATRPLAEVVATVAASAALRDPRFPPVRPEELADLEIEISVLSAAVPVVTRDPADIRPGRHGVIVRQGWHQSVLLPQVAVEHGWAAEELLSAACKKAGLAPEAWRASECELYVFQAEIITE